MIVKNEEKYIKECLESVKDIADEIVIVDTGSTDKTINIAESFGAKIFHFEWINDFASARNFALENSTGDWILYLDADERLSLNSKKEIKKLTLIKGKEAYYCRINNINNITNRSSVMAYVRLFPNDKNVRFEGAIHEQIENSLLRNNYRIKNSKIEIDHIGYNIPESELKLKANRNLKVLLQEYKRNKTSYLSFHLGQTYGILGNKEEAISYFYEAIENTDLKNEYRALAYRYIALTLAEKQVWDKATEYIDDSIKCDSDQPLNLFAASEIYLKNGRAKEAGSFCYRAYNVNKQFTENGKSSYQSILLDSKNIIYQGLKIAVTSGDAELFNLFFPLLKNDRGMNEGFSIVEFQMYDDLLNNKAIDENKIKQFLNYIDEKNIEFVLALLDKYDQSDTKIQFLKMLSNTFPSNAILLNKLGVELMKMNDYTNAELILEKAFNLNEDYPSTIFYLVSAYVRNNSNDKISSLITSSEIKYAANPAILEKLGLLKEKLNL